MKAVVRRQYGSSAVLRIEDTDTPSVRDDQVLVQVIAASINPLDWHTMRGQPYAVRLGAGLRTPKNSGLGADLAGRIASVGANVSAFAVGDEVFGQSISTLAEYIAVSATGIAIKPANLNFEQAAAVPLAGFTALQGVRDRGRVQPGQTVLINGASGGVGSFAVQIAKAHGAEVTGVCSTDNEQLVRSIGADHVVDYALADFADGRTRYDLVFDAVGNRSLRQLRRAPESGRNVGIGRRGGRPLDCPVPAADGRRHRIPAKPSAADTDACLPPPGKTSSPLPASSRRERSALSSIAATDSGTWQRRSITWRLDTQVERSSSRSEDPSGRTVSRHGSHRPHAEGAGSVRNPPLQLCCCPAWRPAVR